MKIQKLSNLFIALTLWALTDVNGRIARFNVAHCRELSGAGVGVDVAYLLSLGPAALPALDVLVMADGVPERVVPDVLNARGKLEDELAGDVDDWRGWTVQRYRLSRTRPSDAGFTWLIFLDALPPPIRLTTTATTTDNEEFAFNRPP